MRILHITAMTTLSPNSGIPAVLKGLSDAQNKICGLNSIVLSIKGSIDDIDSPYFRYLGNRSFLSFIDEYNPDIAIIHGFFHVEYIKVARVLTKVKIPFFIEPHGSFGKQAMRKSMIKKAIANCTVFRKLIKESKGYIFLNNAELKNSIYRTGNDLVIPNGVHASVVYNAKEKENYLNPVFYFLGRFDIHHKGLDYLFDALDILEQEGQQYNVKLFGIGDKKQNNFVNKRIKNYKYLNIINCGTIYGEGKKKALETCNILLLTSRYEGAPMAVLEALSYGNPCVVTPGTNVADEIESNYIGWKTQLDPKNIANSIKNAREMYVANGEEYFSRCKQYVLDNYNWDQIAVLSKTLLKKQLDE